METRKSTTAGVLFWTPAPARNTPTSSVISDDVWEDENEDQAEQDDDFFSQMDENGIIGLSEALEEIEFGVTCGNAADECNTNLFSGPLTPEEADLSGHDRDTPPEELSYNQTDHLSHTKSPGEEVQILSSSYHLAGSLTADEEVRQNKEEQVRCLAERVKYFNMTEGEKDEEEPGKRSDKKRMKNKHLRTLREPGTVCDLTESYISKGETEKMSSTSSCSANLPTMEPAGVSSHRCPVSQPASAVTAPTFPHLLHFNAEETAAAPGIKGETIPEMSLIESSSESPRSHISSKSSPRHLEIKPKASVQPAVTFSEEMSKHYRGESNGPLRGSVEPDKLHKRPSLLPRRTRQHSPEATYSSHPLSTVLAKSLKCKHKTTSPDREPRIPRATRNAAEVDKFRNEPLSHRTPDFSRVEPKVRFPKGGYKPPKSRRSFQRKSLSPEPPVVFKSPADIVKEVLLNVTDGSPAPSVSYEPPASVPDFIVPQEFRCRQQATTLLEQLQEDYNTLLTKYAEAENTIDRLRLEAKVNLHSDAPKPGHLVQSGLNQVSRFMILDIPQARRAEISSASLHSNGQSTHQRSSSASPSTRNQEPEVERHPHKILYSQANKFLQQLQIFEDLLQSQKLKPCEQMKGLSQFAEGLDSLERGYLLARDEHKVLQQQGAEISHFDPERELEGLIFQCGLRMEELKDQVGQMRQLQPTCEAPPSPPLHSTPLSVPSEGGDILTHPQSPSGPLLVDSGEAAAEEASSASEKSDEEMEDEETLNSLYLKPQNDKQSVEQDSAKMLDHLFSYQSFEEHPELSDRSQSEVASLPAARRTDMQPGDALKERQSQGAGNLGVQKNLSRRKSDQQDSPPVSTSKQRTSRSSPSRRASSRFTTLPVHPSSSRGRLKIEKSHSSSLSSLGEISALERKNSKLQPGSSRVLSQDGIISPETDSGFVGSESSRLTLAAAPSAVHQRASESVSVPQEGNPGKPHTGPLSAPSPACSSSHSGTAMKPDRGSQLRPDQPRRTRQGHRRRPVSCSRQHWFSQTEQGRADSRSSEFGLESESTNTVSEEEQNDQYTESVSSLHSSRSSSSPTSQHHHGDSFRALSSSQVANRNDAIQTLQAEVTRLKERLESCLKTKEPLSSVRAAPSAEENYAQYNTSTPHVRSEERRGEVSSRERDRQTADEVQKSTAKRTTRKRQPSAHRLKQQPDVLTASEPSTPQPQPQVSRCTQTSAAAPDSCWSHANTVCSRTHLRQRPGVSVQMFEAADEPDSKSRQARVCPQCLSRHRGRPEVDGNREPTQSSHCPHCPLCGCPEAVRNTEPDCRRVSDSPTHTRRQPAESQDGAARGRHFAAAAPPALLQCIPVCPPPLLLYSSPLYISPSNSTGTSAGVRGRREAKGRTGLSLSADKQHSVDGSLNRAIRAARHMKHTSGHMAHSLAAGLQYQELLTQSCSY